MNTHLMRRMAAMFLALAVLFSGAAAFATSATAGTYPPPVGGSGGGKPKPGNGNPSTPPPPKGNDGGGTDLPPQAVQSYATMVAPETRVQIPFYGWKTCARKADGRYAKAVSYISWYEGGYGDQSDYDPKHITSVTNVVCVYPPAPVLSTVYCPIWFSGVITGPYSNPNVASGTIVNTGRKYTKFSKSNNNLKACMSSAWTLSVNAPMTQLGRYKAVVQGQIAKCVRRDYPQSTQDPDIKSCTNMPVQTWNGRGAVWCDGYSTTSWPSGHSYTMDECLSRNRGTVQCAMTGKPTYGGLSTPVEAFHDGRNRTAGFPGLRVNGNVRNVKVTGTTFSASGTPMRDGVGANASTQPFVAGIKFGTKYTTDVRTFPLNFQSAGHPNDPFKITKKSNFTADFKRLTITAKSLDLHTGKFVMTQTTTWVKDSGSCSSKPLAIDVLRARNTN